MKRAPCPWFHLVALVSALAVSCKAQSGDSVSAREPWVLAPEFAPVRETLMAWDPEFETYYQELAEVLVKEADLTLVVPPAYQEQANDFATRLGALAVSPFALHVVTFPIESVWMRDFGPLVVRRGEGLAVAAMQYPAREADDQLANEIAEKWLRLPIHELPLRFEGGNLQTDGAGSCFVSTRILTDNLNYSEPEILGILHDAFGCVSTEVVLPLLDEPTGHVDMLLTVTGPREVIVGKYARGHKVQAQAVEQLDTTAEELAQRGYLVRRVPMPPPLGDTHRSYTNALAVNQVVLVPSYSNQDQEEFLETLAVYADAYPGREIMPIDASQIIALKGAIHCTLVTIAQ